MEIIFWTSPFQVCHPINEPSCSSAMHCELRMQVCEVSEVAQSRILEVTTMVVDMMGRNLHNTVAGIHSPDGGLQEVGWYSGGGGFCG
jgi:hypothetical protein